jgi:hypothetical protein
MATRSEQHKAAEMKKMTPELTLDDIQSYTLQLKDNGCDIRRSSFMNSTDGLMGSVDSLGDSTAGSSVDGLNYANLRANMSRHDEFMAGSKKAFVDYNHDQNEPVEADDENEWEYPDLDPSPSSVERHQSNAPNTKRRPSRRLVAQDSTRAMFGDDKDSDDPLSYQN